MSTLATIAVRSKADGELYRINEADFDSALYERTDGVEASQPDAGAASDPSPAPSSAPAAKKGRR